jgi:hypothetical protein
MAAAIYLCCNFLKDIWENKLVPFDKWGQMGLGTVDIKPYDNTKEYPGVNYCLKREKDEKGVERERYDYLSEPLIKMLTVNN